MKFLSLICLLFFTITSQAQESNPCPCNNDHTDAFEPKLQGEVYQRLSGLVGVEYYIPLYLPGNIFLENGEVAVGQQIRYNGRLDDLLLMPPYSREILLDKYFIKGFCIKNIDNSVIYFSKIKVVKEFSGDSMQIFGQILYKNKLSLYAFRHYVFQEDVLENVGSKQIARKLYGPSFIYYFRLPNNKTIGFKRFRRRDLYEIFPTRKDEMKKLFRENHQHRFKREADLIRITEILNEIIN